MKTWNYVPRGSCGGLIVKFFSNIYNFCGKSLWLSIVLLTEDKQHSVFELLMKRHDQEIIHSVKTLKMQQRPGFYNKNYLTLFFILFYF